MIISNHLEHHLQFWRSLSVQVEITLRVEQNYCHVIGSCDLVCDGFVICFGVGVTGFGKGSLRCEGYY